jgi:hypothetical protein
MHIQAQFQDPIAFVDDICLAATVARYCFFFHRADNLQRVLFVVGSCHLISAPVGFEPSLLDYAGARE